MIVDVHAHLFNADDLPVAGFISHSELVRGLVGSRALGRLLARVVQGRAPGFETDGARLRRLLTGRELAAAEPQPALEAEESTAWGALDADPVLRAEVGASLAQLDRPGRESFAPADIALADIALAGIALADIARAVRWVTLFAQSRVDLPGQYADSTGSEVTLVIPMMVDLDAGTEDASETTQAQQVELFEGVSLASMRGLLPGAGRLAVHPFVAFDPVRQLRHANGAESPLELVERAVLSHGFVGVKVYPPMGWRPSGNADREDLAPGEGERLDEIVLELAGWCASFDVPITAHCNDSHYADDDYDDFGAPARWKPLLEAHPDLRLDLGHFGGSHPRREDYGWTEQIAGLMSDHDHLYADVSSHRVEDPGRLALQMRVLTELRDRGHPIATRVMFGTDWYLQAINPEPGSFLDTYRRAWLNTFGGAAVDDFMAGNALRFLGFDDPANQNASRLAARYDAAEVARPEWLARPRS